jgi:hypothetical protein
MKQEIYAMRRANGDWFAMNIHGRMHLLVFRSLEGAGRLQKRNPELIVFRPAPLDERALGEIATANDGRPVRFWLVDEEDPAAELKLGRPLEYNQLVTLEGVRELPGRP